MRQTFLKKYLMSVLLGVSLCSTAIAETVLVTIGQSGQVSDRQLEAAMKAAPFASQFPTLDEKDQAYLRGDMLLRLAQAEALHQEALTQKIPASDVFKQEMGNFKTSLLAQRYLLNLGKSIQVPDDIAQQLKQSAQNNSDALKAARSAYIAKRFNTLKTEKLNALRQQAHVKTYFDRLDHAKPDTLLAEGNGFKIHYGDLMPNTAISVDKARIQQKVEQWIDLILMAKAAQADGISVDNQLQDYAHNLAIRLLLAQKEQQWIPNEQVLLDYFQQHPKIGYIPERRQIGQIVLGSQKQAEEMRQRIMNGESLFTLAGQYSIDPYGRQRSGDMGWLTEGSGSPEIEAALKTLKNDEISPIIKTEKGWHIITIVDRKSAEQRNYNAVKDRVKQKLLAEKMTAYLKQITEKYPLQWHIPQHTQH